MNENFYVYGYIRLDSNSYFYIGKGHGKRCFAKQGRPQHFLNILNKVPCALEIIRANLNEDEAYALEKELIDSLVFEEGYSIDIPGFRYKTTNHLTNKYWGGTGGCAGIPKPKHVIENLRSLSKCRIGSLNPVSKKVICLNTLEIFESINLATKKYKITTIRDCCKKNNKFAGLNEYGEKLVWRYYDEYLTMSNDDVKKEVALAQVSRNGENNSFYSKKHSEETIDKLRMWNLGRKQSSETKAKYDRCGEKNNMYGRKGELSPIYGIPKSDECKAKLSIAKGTKVKCIELNITYNSLNEVEREFLKNYNIKINRKTIVNRMKPTSKLNWCGEILIDGVLTKLHWEYVNK